MRTGPITFIAALTLYLLTLAPDITWAHWGQDGGDLITAAMTGGVPHPTGYPSYLLLGKLIRWLPFGTIAYRFNLLSALCMAGAAGTMAHALHQKWGNGWAAAGAALLFATSRLVWEQAVITEVYALNAFAIALLLAAVLRKESPFVIGLLWGLACTTHLTSVMFVLLFAVYAPFKDWPKLIAGWLIGLLPFLLIFVWGAGDSPVVWGEPSTLQGWWWVVSGRIYRPNLFNANMLMRLPTAVLGMVNQFAIVGWLAVIVGLAFSRSSKRLSSAIAVTALAYAVYALGYDPPDAHVFALPALLLLTVPLAEGLHRAGVAAVLLPLVAVALHFPSVSLHGDWAVRAQSEAALAKLAPDAIALAPGNNSIFTLWYFHYVEEIRPDIVPIDANLLAFDWYRARLSRLYPSLLAIDKDDLAAFVAENGLIRPICYIDLEADNAVSCD